MPLAKVVSRRPLRSTSICEGGELPSTRKKTVGRDQELTVTGGSMIDSASYWAFLASYCNLYLPYIP